MKTIVVYYSMSGNAEYVAETIAEKTGADLLKIEPEKAYPDKGARKFIWGGKSAVMGDTPKLVPYEFDADAYDKIVFAFPVWASNITPPIRSFIKENPSVKEKEIYAAVCFLGGGADKALDKLKKEVGKESLAAELILIDPKVNQTEENAAKIAEFCEEI